MKWPRLNLLLFLLRVQAAFGALLLVGIAFQGAFLIAFQQLPGGLLDAAAPRNGGHGRSIATHLGYMASVAALLLVRREPRITSLVHAVGSVVAFPFGTVLAFVIWHRGRNADWNDARDRANNIRGRNRLLIGAIWLATAAASGVLSAIGYVGIVGANALAGLAAILVALAIQALGLWAVAAAEERTKLQTYEAPLPNLPDYRGNP